MNISRMKNYHVVMLLQCFNSIIIIYVYFFYFIDLKKCFINNHYHTFQQDTLEKEDNCDWL